MARRKQGRRVKRQTQQSTDSSKDLEAQKDVPRAFVFSRGKVPGALKALVENLKQVMSPNTARALRSQKRNKLRDFVHVAGQLNVSFFLIISATDKAAYLRLVRSPRGPTLSFRIRSYTLASDLAAMLRKPYSAGPGIWQSSPLLVLSGFDKEVQHQALMATMLQNVFPTIKPDEVNLAACRRVVLLHKRAEEEGGGVELRQYVIKAAPTNVSKGVKRLMRASKLPSLGKYADMSEYLLKGGGYSSESAAETDDEEKVKLAQDYVGRGAICGSQVGIKLQELGPRMMLELVKVQEGLCDGAVLYHSLVHKEAGEAEASEQRREEKAQQKLERKEAQEANVARKRAAKEEKKSRRKRPRRADEDGGTDEDGGGTEAFGMAPDANVSDAEWYRREVGHEPDPEMGFNN